MRARPDHPSPTAPAPTGPPTWSTWRVGSILFCINQLDVVLRGDATTAVWLKGGLTYLVPFCVSNAGVLVATKRR